MLLHVLLGEEAQDLVRVEGSLDVDRIRKCGTLVRENPRRESGGALK